MSSRALPMAAAAATTLLYAATVAFVAVLVLGVVLYNVFGLTYLD